MRKTLKHEAIRMSTKQCALKFDQGLQSYMLHKLTPKMLEIRFWVFEKQPTSKILGTMACDRTFDKQPTQDLKDQGLQFAILKKRSGPS